MTNLKEVVIIAHAVAAEVVTRANDANAIQADDVTDHHAQDHVIDDASHVTGDVLAVDHVTAIVEAKSRQGRQGDGIRAVDHVTGVSRTEVDHVIEI